MAANATAPKIRTETNGPYVTGIAVGFAIASAAVFSLRLYTRLFLLKTAGKDDWTICIAMVCAVVVTMSTCMEVRYGMGKHTENVSAAEMREQLKYLFITILHYNMGMNVAKVSFLLQYRRIFVDRVVRRVCAWAMAYVAVWACVQATLLGLSCLPISFIVPSTAGFCLDTLPIWYFSSAMSLITDLAIFCIPLRSVLQLQLPRKQKFMLFGIFCLGFGVCIISMYRMFTLRTAVFSDDPTWDNIGAAIWSVIELNTSIIAASLPTIRPLLAKWLPRAGLSSARKSSDCHSGLSHGGGGGGGGKSRDFGSARRGDEVDTGAGASTDDLVLKDFGGTGTGGLGYSGGGSSVFTAHPMQGGGGGGGGGGGQVAGVGRHNIVVTTETSVKEDRRERTHSWGYAN
ncbi:hypothetical protein CGRA01v4_11092 [Colletotrichum graminicola]|uniref:Rhodopsin domain-containing protein n=1 Tax=Colletotrichum graminicola (strain M1.001 / M2 / FGSC 10212) TaxID=645133 RepID=E3QKV7_COLGM|nr:uncharacterized protein GLRG_06639 [Colletotrichum graminicola M1.001]EFQ31495.1 hypothetical protein GLRG_06639 [Colletotrichum graminicola M1.001]WDK19805.1 hypothetical protein CGRA01v4_11092 [Colletotrichum graminicola]